MPRVLDEVVNDVMQDMPDNPWAALVRPIYSSYSLSYLSETLTCALIG